MTVTFSAFSTVTGDTEIIANGTDRRKKNILSLTMIGFTANSPTILSNTLITSLNAQSITSSAKIAINQVQLKIVKESDPFTEVGTELNPIIFASANAGELTPHPDNAFLLYNDKDGTFDSTDAKNITFTVLEFSILDEAVGVSDGTPSQNFTIAYSPVILNDSQNPVKVKVGITLWTEVQTFMGTSNTDQVFMFDYTTGTVTFGNGINGAIPINGDDIFVTYSPNTTRFGNEARSDGWLGVQSFSVVSNDRVVELVPSVAPDLTHVQLFHIPLKSVGAVQGIWLQTDPNRLGINYFTSGSYNDATGLVTLGTALPSGTIQVLADYTYIIKNDAEAVYTSLSKNVSRTFTNSIPSKNAKKINFAVNLPATLSPTSGIRVQFRLRITYTEY